MTIKIILHCFLFATFNAIVMRKTLYFSCVLIGQFWSVEISAAF